MGDLLHSGSSNFSTENNRILKKRKFCKRNAFPKCLFNFSIGLYLETRSLQYCNGQKSQRTEMRGSKRNYVDTRR